MSTSAARAARGVLTGLGLGSLGLLSLAFPGRAWAGNTTVPPAVDRLPMRVVSLKARVVTLSPRIVTLSPRVRSVAPRPTTPGTFTVSADVLFAFNRSDLGGPAQAVLRGVVTKLHAAGPGTVTITGYTDSIGTKPYNLALSQRRAASVLAYLQAHVGNRSLTYRAVGRGEADPVAPNTVAGKDNPAGRAKNRRVVISYVRR